MMKPIGDIRSFAKQLNLKFKDEYGENKRISCSLIEDIYQEYQDYFTFPVFLQDVFEVKYSSFKSAKSSKKNVTIFFVRDTLTDDEVLHIIELMKKDGYSNAKIDKTELNSLYLQYGQGLTKKSFALRVLNLSLPNYKKCLSGQSVHILKCVLSPQEVKEMMILKGYQNYELRSSSQFDKLYRDFNNGLSQSVFLSDVLGITSSNLKNLGKDDFFVKILYRKYTEQEVLTIQETLKNRGYEKKSIQKLEFIQLYQEFGKPFRNYEEFAMAALNMTYGGYRSIFFNHRGGVILKPKQVYDNIDMIQDELIKKGFLNCTIDLSTYMKLLKEYGSTFRDQDFAYFCLELTAREYSNLLNYGTVVVMKKRMEKEILGLQQYFLKRGFQNKSISIVEFDSIYTQFGTFLSKRQFASLVFLIPIKSFDWRYESGKELVLFPKNEQILDEYDYVKMKNELKSKGYVEQRLSVDEIDHIATEFHQDRNKYRFLSRALSVNQPYEKKEVVSVLEKKDILKEEQIFSLIEQFQQDGIYGTFLDSFTISELYETYGEGLTFSTFLYQIMGISRQKYSRLKNSSSETLILNPNTLKKLYFIKNHYFLEDKYYSQQEIMDIIAQYEIDLFTFICYMFSLDNKDYLNDSFLEYEHLLDTYHCLWIGKGKISNSCFQDNYDEISSIIHSVISSVENNYWYCFKFNDDICDAYQSLLLFFLEYGGELEHNFITYGNDKWKGYLHKILQKKLLNMYCFDHNSYIYFEDKNADYLELVQNMPTLNEEDVFSSYEDCKEDIYISYLDDELLKGYDFNTAISHLSQQFSLSRVEILHYLKKYFCDLSKGISRKIV